MGVRESAVSAIAFALMNACGRIDYARSSDLDAALGDGGAADSMARRDAEVAPEDGSQDAPADGVAFDVSVDAPTDAIAFDSGVDAYSDADATDSDGDTSDASGDSSTVTSPRLDVAAMVKLTVEAPVLQASAVDTECTWRLAQTRVRGPTAFSDGESIWIGTTCKARTVDARWNYVFARWTPDTPTAAFVDGDAVTPGTQPAVLGTAATSSGAQLRNTHRVYWAWVGGGLYGLAWLDTSGSYRQYPVVSSTGLEDLDALDYRVDLPNHHMLAAADGSWRGASIGNFAVHHEDGLFYIYFDSRNAPLDNESYVGVRTSPDFFSLSAPIGPLLTGFENPFVSRDVDGTYHMLAFDRVSQRWAYIPGDDPLTWHEEDAIELRFAPFQGALGAWDSTGYAETLAGEPRVVGMVALRRSLYVFYMAQRYEPDTDWTDLRGIGVFRIPLL